MKSTAHILFSNTECILMTALILPMVSANLTLKRLSTYVLGKSPIADSAPQPLRIRRANHNQPEKQMDSQLDQKLKEDTERAVIELFEFLLGAPFLGGGSMTSFEFPRGDPYLSFPKDHGGFFSFLQDYGDFSFPADYGDFSFPLDYGDFSFPLLDGSFSFPLFPDLSFSMPYTADWGQEGKPGKCPSLGTPLATAENFSQLQSCPLGALKCNGTPRGGGLLMDEFASPTFVPDEILICKPENIGEEIFVQVEEIYADAGVQHGLKMKVLNGNYLISAVYVKAEEGGNLYTWDDFGKIGGESSGVFTTLGKEEGIKHVDMCVIPCPYAGSKTEVATAEVTFPSSLANSGNGQALELAEQSDSLDKPLTSHKENDGMSGDTQIVVSILLIFGAVAFVGLIVGHRYRQVRFDRVDDNDYSSLSSDSSLSNAAAQDEDNV